MGSDKGTILLTGGTGKLSSRIAPLLSSNGNKILIASRSGKGTSLPQSQGVKFDWFNQTTWENVFSNGPIFSIFLIAPPVINCLPIVKPFLDIAVKKGVKRVVLVSASLLEDGDGPMTAEVAAYIISLGVEYAILRPTWFMENFSEMQHLVTIRDQDQIITAAGDGRLPFVSADDIAAVAFRALTDEIPHNEDHLVLGAELLSYDDVAALLTKKLGRKITHIKISEAELAKGLSEFIPEDYSKLLAQLDTAVREGKEERLNDVVEKVTGKKAVRLEEFVDRYVKEGIWNRKEGRDGKDVRRDEI